MTENNNLIKKSMKAQLDAKVRSLEDETIDKINHSIGAKVTPIYNGGILVFAAVFAYFLMIEQN